MLTDFNAIKLGYKIDNCSNSDNIIFLNSILKQLNESQPLEIGLECYDPRFYDKNSELIQIFSEKTINHSNKIAHLTLTAKVLNVTALTEEEWISIWKDQVEPVNKINPRYLVIHATSKESRKLHEDEQITNICLNFPKIENIFNRPLFIENTYEDLDFYEKLFLIAPKSMNFVFDIGHMKVHSKRTMDEWIYFLDKLRNEGRQIHFHLHDNNCIYDLHKTISKMNDPEVIKFVIRLIKLFPEFNFILESHSNNFAEVEADFKLINLNLNKKIIL
jgi:hypothetical protein